MPYINTERRGELWSGTAKELMNNPGELNYKLTVTVLEYLGHTPNYERFDAAIGALECCKLELYRRMVVPYEDRKIVENGDVYPKTTPLPVASLKRFDSLMTRHRKDCMTDGSHNSDQCRCWPDPGR